MSATRRRSPTIVIGIGNPLRSDDGVGPAVIDALAAVPLAETIELVVLDGEPTGLVEAWDGRTLAVVVDAVVSGEPPGTIHLLGPGHDDVGALGGWYRRGGTHGAGLAEALALGEALGRLPQRLVILGVDAAELALGAELSAPVAAAVPLVAERVRTEVTTATQVRPDREPAGGSAPPISLG